MHRWFHFCRDFLTALASIFWVFLAPWISSEVSQAPSPSPANFQEIAAWSRAACCVTASTGEQVLEFRPKLHFREDLGTGYGIVCLSQTLQWVSVVDNESYPPCGHITDDGDDASGASQNDAEHCAYVASRGEAFIFSGSQAPLIRWAVANDSDDYAPAWLDVSSNCWPSSGACARTTRARLVPAPSPARPPRESIWRGESHGYGAVLQMSEDSICAVLYNVPQMHASVCAGCSSRSSGANESDIVELVCELFSSPQIAVAQINWAASAIRKVHVQLPTDVSEQIPVVIPLTQSSMSWSMPTNAFSWTCAPNVNSANDNESHWVTLSKKSGAGGSGAENMAEYVMEVLFLEDAPRLPFAADVQSCTTPASAIRNASWARQTRLPHRRLNVSTTEQDSNTCGKYDGPPLAEASDTGAVFRFLGKSARGSLSRSHTFTASLLAPGLWRENRRQYRWILDPIGGTLWVLPPSRAGWPCVPHLSDSRRNPQQLIVPGAWAPPAARHEPCPAGQKPSTNVNVTTVFTHFFYRPAICPLAHLPPELGPGENAPSCRCPWMWARAGENVSVDGAALTHGCAVWVPRPILWRSWRLNGAPPRCGEEGANVESQEWSSRGIPSACVVSQVCSSNFREAQRKCLPDKARAGSRCFAETQTARTAPEKSPLLHLMTRSRPRPFPSGRALRGCVTEKEIEAHVEETRALAPLFLPVVRGQLLGRFVGAGIPFELVQVIGRFVGAPWTSSSNRASWSSGEGDASPAAPFKSRSPVASLLPDFSNFGSRHILYGMRRPAWRGDREIPPLWDAADLDMTFTPTGRITTGTLIRIRSSSQGESALETTGFIDRHGEYATSVERASWCRDVSSGAIVVSLLNSETNGLSHVVPHQQQLFPSRVAHLLLQCDIHGRIHIQPQSTYVISGIHMRSSIRDPGVSQSTDPVLVEPLDGPTGAEKQNKPSSLIMTSALAVWAPVSPSGAAVPRQALPVAFVPNLFYLTSHVRRLNCPPYLNSGSRQIDWRLFYRMVPMSSTWREDGTLTVIFRLAWLGPDERTSWWRGYSREPAQENAYVVFTFVREAEIRDAEREKREFDQYWRTQWSQENLHLRNEIPRPPMRSERLSPTWWLRPSGWRFLLGAPARWGSVLLPIENSGVMLWQVPPRSSRSGPFISPGTSLHEMASVHITGDAQGFWIPTPLPSDAQVFSRKIEPSRQPALIEKGRFLVNVAVLQITSGGVVRLTALARDAGDPSGATVRLSTPLLSFFELRTFEPGAKLVQLMPWEALPITERLGGDFGELEPAGSLYDSFESTVANMGHLWRETSQIPRSRFEEHGVVAWRLRRFVRTGWAPLPSGRVELRVVADQVLRKPNRGFLTVRVRRIVIRPAAPAGSPASVAHDALLAHSILSPEKLVQIATQNSCSDAPADVCFMCRANLGAGRPNCFECSEANRRARRRWPWAQAAPTRVHLPTDDLLQRSTIQYDEVGTITLSLRLADFWIPEW